MKSSLTASSEDIAEINEMIRQQLKPGPYAYSVYGPKHLKGISLSEKASVLLEGNPVEYEKVLAAIRTAPPTGRMQRDFGVVEVEKQKYYWQFRYWDSTGHFHMPNGHRELVISLEEEIKSE